MIPIMDKQFAGLRKNPYSVTPDPRCLFLGMRTDEALACLTHRAANKTMSSKARISVIEAHREQTVEPISMRLSGGVSQNLTKEISKPDAQVGATNIITVGLLHRSPRPADRPTGGIPLTTAKKRIEGRRE